MSRPLRSLAPVARAALALTAALALANSPSHVAAFCGFYVAGSDDALRNHASTVVLLREGTQTVVSMSNDYAGPPEDFAMVVPVPVVLHRQDVRTLPRDVFHHIDALGAPRLVEYWEEDPCEPRGEALGLGSIGTIGHGSGSGYGMGAVADAVRVEAEFAVGEYDVVVLGADDSTALETWLHAHDYRVPAGAAEALRPYVEDGMKFFVARVDVDRVHFEDGHARLSPLRFHYEAPDFSLPVRLGLLNSDGTQDLIVNVLARQQRYEVASYDNVFIPTNLDVDDAARDHFGEVYATLFDRTLEAHPGAVVTEYAWGTGTCDPCPPEGELEARDIATLGGDIVFPGGVLEGRLWGHYGPTPNVHMERPVTHGIDAEVARRVERRHINELRFCFEQQVMRSPALQGDLTLEATLESSGAVTNASVVDSTLASEAVGTCAVAALRRWMFPEPSAVPATIRTTYHFGMQGSLEASPTTYADEWVLTRLHYRYGRDGLGQDLVFRAAPAVQGGRESLGEDGSLERGAQPALTNNFQARYVIRHPWTGAVACAQPVHGQWGGPPNGALPPRMASATDLGLAARGGIALADVIRTPVADLGLSGASPTSAAALPPSPTPPPTPPTTSAAAPAAGGGCGCSLPPSRAPAGTLACGSIVAWLLALRRRLTRR